MLDSSLRMLAEKAGTYLAVRIGGVNFAPEYTAVLLFAFAAALLSALLLWRIGKQESHQRRLEVLRLAVSDRRGSSAPERQQWYQRLGAIVATSPIVGKSEQQRLIAALASAGVRNRRALVVFITIKVCGGLGLAGLFSLVGELQQLVTAYLPIKIALPIAGLMLGWRLPEMVLSRMAARRRLKMEQGLPDALDLLVICAEAGLSLDQAIDETARELATASPVVAEELTLTAAEMRVLADRSQALQNLVKRTGVTSLHGVVATLTQALKFGTPLAESVRVIAGELRNARLARIEERAARLPVLLAIPLMAFILPALFMILGTPVALRLFDFLGNISFPATLGAP